MQSLDRLDWAAGVVFAGDGVRIGIRSNTTALIERVAALVPPRWRRLHSPVVDQLYSLIVAGISPIAGERHAHHLFVDHQRRYSSRNVEDVLDVLESDLHFQQAISARRSLYVHAGVVAWNGRAILVPGPSMSGKSTLVAALVRAGATYYSDEFAVLDGHGRVHPYPKRLSLRDAHGEHKTKYIPDSVGGRPSRRTLPVGLIAVTSYRKQARWRPRALSPAQALLALLENTPLARSRPTVVLNTLRAAVQEATAVRSSRAEADRVAPALLRLLD